MVFFLVETTSLSFFSTPFFLAAQRRVVSSRQEEVAWRVAARLAQLNKRAAALLKSLGFPAFRSSKTVFLLRALVTLSCWTDAAYRFGQFSTIFMPSSKSSVFGRHKALLLCKSPCEGAASVRGRPRSHHRRPQRREISRGNLLFTGSKVDTCCSAPGLCENASNWKCLKTRTRVLRYSGARSTGTALRT